VSVQNQPEQFISNGTVPFAVRWGFCQVKRFQRLITYANAFDITPYALHGPMYQTRQFIASVGSGAFGCLVLCQAWNLL
jgi:hypothetical protein